MDWEEEKTRVEEILHRADLPVYEISVSAAGEAAADAGGWFVMVQPEGGLRVKPELIEPDDSDRVQQLLQDNGYEVAPRPREGDGSVWVRGRSSQ